MKKCITRWVIQRRVLMGLVYVDGGGIVVFNDTFTAGRNTSVLTATFGSWKRAWRASLKICLLALIGLIGAIRPNIFLPSKFLMHYLKQLIILNCVKKFIY
jgi:hypothetical protein